MKNIKVDILRRCLPKCRLMKDYKMGCTTGVYDMFRIGHLNILKKPKEQCDQPIVGIRTDELVEHEKNNGPVIPFEKRMKIVSAIRYVDEVIPQLDKDKFLAWERYHFDKMFVGSDWKGTLQWNKFEMRFKPLGVEIVYLPHTGGISSTKLNAFINKMLEELPVHRGRVKYKNKCDVVAYFTLYEERREAA